MLYAREMSTIFIILMKTYLTSADEIYRRLSINKQSVQSIRYKKWARRMKIKILFGLGGVVIGSLIVVAFYPSNRTTQDAGMHHRINLPEMREKPNEVKVNAIAQFYIRQDGTGLTTIRVHQRKTEMIVDRDVNFTWERRNDHVIMLTYKNTLRWHNDNTPDALWGALRARTLLHYSLTSLCVFIQDRLYPTYICRED